MQILTPELIQHKRVLLRLDLDVPIQDGKITDDYRLQSCLPTLDFCVDYAKSVVIMGHIGRPEGKEVPKLSVKPIVSWFEENFHHVELPEGKLHILENLRFEKGEQDCDLDFAKKLAELGDVFVNEAFAAHHKAASVTVLPTLLPHAAGFHFTQEVEHLSGLMQNPDKPFVAIIGGVKIEDKLPGIQALAAKADAVLVGGKIAQIIKDKKIELPQNVFVGTLNEQGTDITEETTLSWKNLLKNAKTILWNGPLGRIEDEKNSQTRKVADEVINSSANTIVGGGDTVGAVRSWGMDAKFSFVSTGGGAMLEYLTKGTLPTIQVLD